MCRLIDDKISFAHQRLWPALVRLSGRFPRNRLARVREIHTERGAHRVEEIPFPHWVSAETKTAAKRLSDDDARAALESVLPEFESAR